MPGAQISLRLRQLAHRHEHEAERGVSDFVVEHPRRVGGDDSEPRRRLGVDVVVADAETGDDLEAGKAAQIGFVGPHMAGERDRADARRPFGEPDVWVGLEPQAMQRQPVADQIADHPMPSTGISTSRDFIRGAPFFPTFAPRPDVALGPPMTSPDGAPQARRRPRARRVMLSDFRSYGELDLKIEGRLVVLCGENGAGKTNLLEALSLFAPGRGLRRAELAECARVGGAGGFTISIEVEEDGETHQLGSGWSRAPMAPKPNGSTASTARRSNPPAPSPTMCGSSG